jgi:hypothetical protein
MNPLDPERLLAANEIYAKVVALARETKDDEKLALALHAQGHSFVLSEELEAAEKAFDESREISARLGDKRRATLSSVMVGYTTILAGRLEDGLPRVVGALTEFAKTEKGEDDPARNLVLLRLAEVAKRFDKKRLDAAIKSASRTLAPEVQAEVEKAVAAGRAG